MRLIDLEPRWLEHNGEKMGFVFRCPTASRVWQTVFFQPTPRALQERVAKKKAVAS